MGIGRPKGAKNVMRTPEEKERIVLEALERGTKRTAEARGFRLELGAVFLEFLAFSCHMRKPPTVIVR